MTRCSSLSRRTVMLRTLVAWAGAMVTTRSAAQNAAGDQVPAALPGPMDAGDEMRDLAQAVRAAAGRVTKLKDGIGRSIAGEIRLPPGRYRISAPFDLAPTAGLVGLTISGSGAGTEIVFDGPAATILCSSSRAITFRDLAFVSAQGVDADQAAFTIAQKGNPIRSWRFERCDFAAFHTCFAVFGQSMSSEFFFDKCQFSQCYYLVHNDNAQAVNWNFVNCNWENGELDTKKDKRLSSAFWLQQGTFVKWTGGSMVFCGRLVFYKLARAGLVQRPAHLIAFDGVRIELEDEGGTHVPFVDRVDEGYVSGTNQPTTIFSNCTILQRGKVPPTVIYARAWANCSISFVDCKAESGRVVGVLDALSPTHTASIRLENTKAISYVEDIRARLNSHDQHSVRILPDNNSAGMEPIVDQRLCSLAAPATMHSKYMYVRGPTGALPLAGTTVALLPLPNHTMLMRLFVQRFQAAGQRLTVELRNRVGQALYGRVILDAGDMRYAESRIGAEVGFQIPSEATLVLRFIGIAEQVPGIVGIEYL